MPLRPIVILGPTAGGKSELAVSLAESLADRDALTSQIISADSMQIYKHMDAGTAKPSAEQRDRAVHHLIDIVEPTDRFTAADWLSRADTLIAKLQAESIRPIVVGGTNLYIRSLLEGMFQGPPADETIRAQFTNTPTTELHDQLQTIDPAAAIRIDINDRRRTIRALEVHQATGHTITELQKQWSDDPTKPYRHDPIILGLHWEAKDINPRINLRVKAMFHPDKVAPKLAREVCPNSENLPDETRRLLDANLLGPQAREALGYKQVLLWLNNEWSLEDAFEKTKILTRRFAKQQRTWLKRYRNVHWLTPEVTSTAEMIEQIHKQITA